MGAFDLVDQMVFYGSYHSNPYNQIVHLIFVPLIMFTALVFACYTGVLFEVELPARLLALFPASIAMHLHFNFAFLLTCIYQVYYLCLGDFFAAFSFDVIVFFMNVGANAFIAAFGWDLAWKYAVVLHLISWYFQIHIGHLVFEKRKPALFDSLFQSFFLAPLFVWFEVLFFFGYKPELYKAISARVSKNIGQFKAEQMKAAKAAKKGE